MLKKGLVKCFDVYGYSLDDNTLLFVDENMTNTGLESACETSEIRNGMENSVWSKLNYAKSLKLSLASNVVDFNKIALLAGDSIVSGVITSYTSAKVYEIDPVVFTIALDKEPIDPTTLQIVDIATDKLIDPANFTYDQTTNTVDFTTGGNTGKVKVVPFAYNELNGEELVIDAEKFPTAFKVVLKTVYVDENGKVSKDVIIELPKCMPSSTWTLGTKTDYANPDDNTLELECLKDDFGALGRIKFTDR